MKTSVFLFFVLSFTGQTSTFGQFFDGSLAGMTLLTGTTETERVIKCMNNCGEKLQFNSMDQLSVGMVSISLLEELETMAISARCKAVGFVRDYLRSAVCHHLSSLISV